MRGRSGTFCTSSSTVAAAGDGVFHFHTEEIASLTPRVSPRTYTCTGWDVSSEPCVGLTLIWIFPCLAQLFRQKLKRCNKSVLLGDAPCTPGNGGFEFTRARRVQTTSGHFNSGRNGVNKGIKVARNSGRRRRRQADRPPERAPEPKPGGRAPLFLCQLCRE